ncbi:hypothetical protein [Sulfobacillus harzensis]|uniref:Uncharacterized protein n=1 Tax=Sulfobacillus harzensis TaxID=2729629 RepID=A0A7Y0L4B7_9FIRM|nr:hypothetical protein [Sulfobacillus harzensis]NMP23063.1 hypothetical protein [Sulfobacillus harzensis]
MRTRMALVAAMTLMALSGCGTQQAKPPKQSVPTTPVSTLKIGPVVFKSGSVWQLNNPGGGTPRESLVIESIHGHRVGAVVYLSEFGSLIEANLKGTPSAKGNHLSLSGTVAEATVSGSSKTRPIRLLLQPVSPKTVWVTQTIPGDTVNSFSQIPFKETTS